jgi:hypothetical protein
VGDGTGNCYLIIGNASNANQCVGKENVECNNIVDNSQCDQIKDEIETLDCLWRGYY